MSLIFGNSSNEIFWCLKVLHMGFIQWNLKVYESKMCVVPFSFQTLLTTYDFNYIKEQGKYLRKTELWTCKWTDDAKNHWNSKDKSLPYNKSNVMKGSTDSIDTASLRQ